MEEIVKDYSLMKDWIKILWLLIWDLSSCPSDEQEASGEQSSEIQKEVYME